MNEAGNARAHLLSVLFLAVDAAATGRWEDVASFAEDIALLASHCEGLRLSGADPGLDLPKPI